MALKEKFSLAVLIGAVGWFVGWGFGQLEFPSRAVPVSQEEIVHTFTSSTVSFRDVRAIYATAAVAASPRHFAALIALANATEVNAIVVNVKDGDGVYLGENMRRVVAELHANGIYPIARVVVFQDNDLARRRPDLALTNPDGTLWASGGGKYRWADPASREVWDYNVDVARKAFDLGFSEVNFDYIRFPSDGDVNAAVFPVYDGKRLANVVMREFYAYLTSEIRKTHPDAVLSVDLFAFSFLRSDGLGVGQRLADAAEFFDVVSPMIYPSHYTSGNFDFPNPAEHPYEVVYRTLEGGKAFWNASSTAVIRPWLQDFDIGATYDAAAVRAEVQAVIDSGAGNTWMIWNPANVYDYDKFLPAAQ
ncbi:MAG: putative glycoside hydrolase [Candidatus Jorgensenbacteria bacterium]|nr:putative glycoside hydrolase [Candidatus Jorgensenbacteria bacterium]